jgi:catechol-2,3-dioxygenase
MPGADLEAVKDRLISHGIPTDGPLDDEDGRGLYLRDLDGNIIELRTPHARPVHDTPSPHPKN